ncbi:MAG TPA: hypothetical protein VIG90_05700 [Pedomonas sp.]|uniref:hypothetical protein n=1 Tax=Pedomonas sp. TaxID=2976421 RepID=UPI002F400A5A
MNEELIKQLAWEVSKGPNSAEAAERAIRLYHARHVAPLVEAVEAYGKALDGAAVAPKNSLAFMGANKAVGEALAPFQQGAPALKRPEPSEEEKEVDAFLAEVRAELLRARTKFPGRRIMTIALAEEFGELAKAMLDEQPEAVRKEAVQTAVMAARVALDGDESVDDWRASKGLGHVGRATLAAAGGEA